MLSRAKIEAMKYLKKEFEDLKSNDILASALGCTVGLRGNSDYFKWQIILLGPLDSPYAGGLFYINFDFPDNYPRKQPEVRFQNKIYHLNVNGNNGHISMPILNYWKAKYSIFNIISDIFASFYEQDYCDAYSYQMAKEYKNNRKEFERKAREWTQQYASIE